MTNNQHSSEKEEKGKEKYNIFRDSPIRYLGYANEVGESFRYQFPKLVTPSYIISFGYCFADAASSGRAAYDKARMDGSSTPAVDSLVSGADTLIWQSLASVAIPGAIINSVVKATRFALVRSPVVLPALASTWLPTGVGLGSIPLIIHPIDHFVDYLMDNTFRQIDWKKMSSSQSDSIKSERRQVEEQSK